MGKQRGDAEHRPGGSAALCLVVCRHSWGGRCRGSLENSHRFWGDPSKCEGSWRTEQRRLWSPRDVLGEYGGPRIPSWGCGLQVTVHLEAWPTGRWLSISLDPLPELPSAWGCRDSLCPCLVMDSGTGLDEDQRTVGAHGDCESRELAQPAFLTCSLLVPQWSFASGSSCGPLPFTVPLTMTCPSLSRVSDSPTISPS